MKTTLQKIISSSMLRLNSTRTALIKKLFPSSVGRMTDSEIGEVKQERKLLKAGDKLYKGIVRRLRKKKRVSYAPYRRKVLLHRRLKQYQQLRRHGSVKAKVQAIHKLEKEWRKFRRDNGRLKDSKIIPLSSRAR